MINKLNEKSNEAGLKMNLQKTKIMDIKDKSRHFTKTYKDYKWLRGKRKEEC